MSSDIALRVEDVSKRFMVGELVSAGDLKRWLAAPLRWLGRRNGHKSGQTASAEGSIRQRHIARHEFWALRDVSFEVHRGEVLGIIGGNGAGKSTLLKILSRITAPTEGRIEVYGRVASLLEIGTGFHQELTGRENIYLNGSILGMRKPEIDSKFDEIVDFAGVEQFIDTPIKRYSSGMKVRLGFAVAAHLEPELLIIDEVLAVGDAQFQKKCLGKMNEVAESGRTVLFVSHNMAAVQSLCGRAIVLSHGKVIFEGGAEQATVRYLAESAGSTGETGWVADVARPQGFQPIIQSVQVLDPNGAPSEYTNSGGELHMRLTYKADRPLRQPTFGIYIETVHGHVLAFIQNVMAQGAPDQIDRVGAVECRVADLPLAPGTYYLSLGCGEMGERLDRLDRCFAFTVQNGDFYGTSLLPNPNQGPLLIRSQWNLQAELGDRTPYSEALETGSA